MVEAVLINEPAIDFATLLGLTGKALGYNIASAADASHRKMNVAEKFISCLSALRDEDAPAGLTPNLLTHVSFSVLVVCEHEDLMDILQAASGMAFVHAPTSARNIDIAVITGTLNQWRDAVASGATEDAEPDVRLCFSKILMLFERAGLASIWNDFNKHNAPDRSGFYLELK